MKKVLLTIIACSMLTAVCLAGTGDESFCPAHRAAEKGYNPFEAFHSVMAPAWHTAWPKKDYEALFAAGPEFEKNLKPIMEMEPDLRDERMENFVSYRDEFAKVVKAYAAAAEAKDEEKVYELMPEVHESFEQTASSLLPVHYPLIESLAMTSRLILETHIPQDNTEGIVGSTETLVVRIEGLNEESIPKKLTDHKAELVKEFDRLKTHAAKMKECCDNDDMDGYKEHVTAFDTQIKKIIKTYL